MSCWSSSNFFSSYCIYCPVITNLYSWKELPDCTSARMDVDRWECIRFHRWLLGFSVQSLEFCTHSLWWRWGNITFDGSWSRLKQWVSLNNRRVAYPQRRGPEASGPAVRVYLVLLLVFLSSLEWANTPLHYVTQALSLNFSEESDKAKYQHAKELWQFMEQVTLNKVRRIKQ